jgi:hypothetical protein
MASANLAYAVAWLCKSTGPKAFKLKSCETYKKRN